MVLQSKAVFIFEIGIAEVCMFVCVLHYISTRHNKMLDRYRKDCKYGRTTFKNHCNDNNNFNPVSRLLRQYYSWFNICSVVISLTAKIVYFLNDIHISKW